MQESESRAREEAARKAEEKRYKEEYFQGDHWQPPSTATAIQVVPEVIEERLKELGWTEDDIFGFQFASSEAVSNGIIYGNFGEKSAPDTPKDEIIARHLAENPADAELTLDIVVNFTKDKATIQVTDRGDGFDPKEIEPETEPTEENMLTPSHRGIWYMRTLTDEVQFEKLEQGMRVTLQKERRSGE